MIKQIYIAECDFCGKIERARVTCGQYNEEVHVLPKGWKHGVNDCCLCADCYTRLMLVEYDVLVGGEVQ